VAKANACAAIHGGAWRSLAQRLVGSLLVAGLAVACDSPKSAAEGSTSSPAPVATSSALATVEPQAPEIIVDHANVAVGKSRVSAVEPHLADRLAVFLRGAPMIEGRVVDVVILRNAKPSQAVGVIDALQQAKAAGAQVKTETRDGATKPLPIAFVNKLPDCAVVAWITKDAALDVWPAGGGRAKRAPRGLAGPDLTLGMDAFRVLSESCEASQFAVGADEAMTWGLEFDVAMEALHQSWTRTSAAVVVAVATPGRKLTL
jgi:hypothetical protein